MSGVLNGFSYVSDVNPFKDSYKCGFLSGVLFLLDKSFDLFDHPDNVLFGMLAGLSVDSYEDCAEATLPYVTNDGGFESGYICGVKMRRTAVLEGKLADDEVDDRKSAELKAMGGDA